jgi:hypothetical protein
MQPKRGRLKDRHAIEVRQKNANCGRQPVQKIRVANKRILREGAPLDVMDETGET